MAPRSSIVALVTLACALAGPSALAAEGQCPRPTLIEDSPPARAPATRLRVGVAFGSGSMHGIAHVGVIRELEARGLEVQVVSGTSVGALVGALWASGRNADEIEALARREDWAEMGNFALSWQGIFSNQPMKDELSRLLGNRPIPSWPRRFGAVATDIETGERVLIRTGDGAAAVQASSAVPVLFSPVAKSGRRLSDGALVEPVPVEAARELGADFVIGVDVAYRPHEEETGGIPSYAFQSVHILVNSLATAQLKTADIAIRMNLHHLMHCGPGDFITEGRNAVRRQWPQIAKALLAKAGGKAAR